MKFPAADYMPSPAVKAPQKGRENVAPYQGRPWAPVDIYCYLLLGINTIKIYCTRVIPYNNIFTLFFTVDIHLHLHLESMIWKKHINTMI